MNIKVSIIIPVYNTKQYLCEALDSAKNQTLHDIEILCIDDGSTDGSAEILDEYAQQDNRFVVIHQPNGGQSVARNQGLDRARGEYIAFLDSDDVINPQYCQLLYEKAVSEDAEYISTFTQLKSRGKIFLRKLLHSYKQINPTMTDKVKRARNTALGPWCMLKTSLIREHRLRFHAHLLFEDSLFILDALQYANRVANVFQQLYYYRQREGSIVHTLKNSLQGVKMFDVLYNTLKDNPPFAEFKPYYYYLKWNSMASVYRRVDTKQDSSFVEELLELLCQYATEEEKSGDLTKKIHLSRKGRLLYKYIYGTQHDKKTFLFWHRITKLFHK